MVVPWFYYSYDDKSMVSDHTDAFSWYFQGCTMVVPWFYYSYDNKSLVSDRTDAFFWLYHGFTIVMMINRWYLIALMHFHGTSRAVPWLYHGYSKTYHGTEMFNIGTTRKLFPPVLLKAAHIKRQFTLFHHLFLSSKPFK